MKLVDLLAMLNDLPVDGLQKHVYIEYRDQEVFGGELKVEPITESCTDPTVIGYVLVEYNPPKVSREPEQLKLPFED